MKQRPLSLPPSLTWSVLAILLLSGCGGGSRGVEPNPSGPVQGESTTVTVVVSSSANDKLSSFHLTLSSIVLSSQSGKTVTLLAKPQTMELIHLNGIAEPLITATVPQDTYTSASAKFSTAHFNYVFLETTGGVHDVIPAVGPGSVTINLAAPLSVSGASMALSLSMPVSQSANYSGAPMQNYTIAPVFNLAPLAIAPLPANATDGLMQNMHGAIASLDAGGQRFTITTAEGANLSFNTASSTDYHGIGGFSQLAAGQFVDLDAALGSDGSLTATRVEVPDTAASDYAVGPILQVIPSSSSLVLDLVQSQGPDEFFNNMAGNVLWFSYSSATFHISSQYRAPQNLPAMSFSASSLTPGQNVFVSLPSFGSLSPPPSIASVTLLPQTVNGVIQSCTVTVNAPRNCTVVLAPYDPISIFAATRNVQVFTTASTQMLNGASLTVGSAARFHGFLFNNNGTLVLVCDQVNSGVTE